VFSFAHFLICTFCHSLVIFIKKQPLAAQNIKIFIASAGEVKAERAKAVLLMTDLRKAHRHLDLEAIEWEYDTVPGSQPGYNTVQGAIDPKLAASHLVVFIFYSRIGQYTREEFELARQLDKKFFAFFKTGFSPADEAEIEAYRELIQFKSSLNSTVLHQQYDDVGDFDKLLYRSLNLYLAENYPAAEPVQLPAEVLTLVRLLGEKEGRIKELEGLLPATNDNTEVHQLTTEIAAIRAQLAQSEELRQQQAADKAALEQQLTSQKGNNQLKAQALEAVEKGDYAAAENLLQESARDSIADAAATFYELGKLKKLQLQYRPAFEYYELAAKIEPGNGLYLNDAGDMAGELGYIDKAIGYFGKSLPLIIADYGERHPYIAIRHNNLGAAYYMKGEYKKAIGYYEQALKVDKKFYGEHHHIVAVRYSNLGEAYRSMEQYDKAIGYLEQALEIGKSFYGERHPDIGIRYNNLGLAYDGKGEYDKAIGYYKQALEIEKSFYDGQHPTIAAGYNNLGVAYYNKGEYNKTIEYCEEALDIYKRFYGERHPYIGTNYNNLGLAYKNKGDYDKAIYYYEKSLTMLKDFLEDTHPNVQKTKENLQLAIEAKAQQG
jgi:tetratricopeptide (TPR) repeat protein